MREFARISFLPIICMFCTVGLFDANAASSVRSFSGTNTYNSASSAASARSGSSAVNAARSASVRTTSGTATTTGTNANTGNAARTASNASTARLSIGSYLKGGTSTSGGSSIKNQNAGSGTSTSSTTDPTIINQIDSIEQSITELHEADDARYTKSEVDDLLDEKQDLLTAGDNITIDANGVISAVVVDGREVLLQTTDTHIQWKYNDATSVWADLIALDDLVGPEGPQGPQGIQGEPGTAADLTNYYTSEQVNNAIAVAITSASGNYATVAQGEKADTALQPNAPSDGSDYVLVINNGIGSWFKVAY